MNNQTEDDPYIRYFNIYINLFYLIVGNTGNLFKVAFFLQKPLRSLPCTVYILVSTFSDFITLNNLPVLQLLIHLYPNYHWITVTVDLSNYRNETALLSYSVSTYDITMCKIRSYLHMLSTDLSFHMLLFASINRYYSSHHRKKRQNNTHCFIRCFCDHPNVYKLCSISSIIIAFLSLQHLFNFTVHFPSEGCVPNNRMLWVIWISSFHCFILPILMIIFGILTLRSIRYLPIFSHYFQRLQHHRQQRKHRFIEICSHCENSNENRIDRQLTSMIIGEVFITNLTSLPYGIYAFYHLIRISQKRTMINPNESVWISLLIRTTMYFEPSCGFYIYLMTLTTLRKRFCKMFIRKIPGIGFFYCNK
jgi:hypothetical protein